MQLVIISDIHDNLKNLQQCLEWCAVNKIKDLLCCGDVCNGETLDWLSKNFSGQIYLVEGNMELYDNLQLKNYDNIQRLGRYGSFHLSDKHIGACHEPSFINEVLENKDLDIIFYGHTHKPWEKDFQGIKTVNPGTLGGVFYPATFATWDLAKNKLDLNILAELNKK